MPDIIMFPSSFSFTIDLRPVAKITIAGFFILLFSSGTKFNDQYILRSKAGSSAFTPAVTSHIMQLNGKRLAYRAKTGYLTLNDSDKNPLANIFYTAYNAGNNSPDTTRPITFVFNGGPGSASIWLHMGAFGPVRAVFENDKGNAPAGDHKYGDNPYSWLDFTDLVFIDPVGTGYSQPANGVDARRFYGYQEDIQSIAEFIRAYLADNNRQLSPKFLAGESYGGLRAIGLASYLQDSLEIELAGVTLISPALNYQLLNFGQGNETPYSYYLPTYAVTAQYQHQLSPQLQQLSPEQLMAKAEAFGQGTYTRFLNLGDAASPELAAKVIDSLGYFTGLNKNYLEKVNGRIADSQFTRQLLQQAHETVGTLDSRVKGANKNNDPSTANIRGLFITAFNSYISVDLKYENRLPYQASTAIRGWRYGPDATNSYVNVSATLKKVMVKNPALKVNVAGGYYDLATSVGSTKYVINHLGLDKSLRNNISVNYYPAGHMIYISNPVNAKFRKDSEKFYNNALNVKS
ncbi:MAG: peptidase S10 [Sphingobacteriaceae bacterium]|nr:MAG: peptidase S10 [Sphingobacteriaceae bacterium]